MKYLTLLLALLLAAASVDADAARRLGGGTSIGRQSGNVTQRQATPPATTPQVAPNRQQMTPAPPAAPQPAPQPPRRRWGGILGGLAAGLGLAWLAHTLGLGDAFGTVLLFGLVILLGMVLIGKLARQRRPLAMQPAPAPADVAVAPRQYSPDKVGNDASARPWERNSMAVDLAGAGQGVHIGSALQDARGWGIPAGFDAAGFVETAKRTFVALQAAWDRADIPQLRSMMTDGMLGEIQAQLAERERAPAGPPNHTDVVMLQAQLLGIEDLPAEYMASVEFSGLIREDGSAGPNPFREVWNMTKPKDGASGWLVAGVQALQ